MKKRKPTAKEEKLLFDVMGIVQSNDAEDSSTKKKIQQSVDMSILGFNSIWQNFEEYIRKRGNSTPPVRTN